MMNPVEADRLLTGIKNLAHESNRWEKGLLKIENI